jgi:hypothetical protein
MLFVESEGFKWKVFENYCAIYHNFWRKFLIYKERYDDKEKCDGDFLSVN